MEWLEAWRTAARAVLSFGPAQPPMTGPREHTEQEFQSLLRRLDLALSASEIGVWEHSLTRDVVTWDARMHRLYEIPDHADHMPSQSWLNALHPDDVAKATADFAEAVERLGSYRSEFRIILPGGRIRHIRSMANFYLDHRGEPAYIGVEWDVTADVELNRQLALQQQLAEERAAALQATRAQVEHAAEHDYLTELPNRRSFDRRMRDLLEADGDRPVAVMHIDLDRFKEINDERGHEAGDQVLRHAARAIRESLRPTDFAARMGGDEFVVVAVDFDGEADLSIRARQIITRLSATIQFAGKRLSPGASVGVASGRARMAEDLLKDADVALYSAKRSGRGRIVFYRPDLPGLDRTQAFRAAEIRFALDQGQILPFYQVLRDTRTKGLAGLEALVRWQHPVKGLLLPEEFLPSARKTGLLTEIDRMMLARVLADAARWEADGKSVPFISLNISPERLVAPSLIEEVERAGPLARKLCFELQAAEALRDLGDATLSAVERLKALGTGIAVSGLSEAEGSLIGLLRLRPDRLKLDRSVISPMTSSQNQLRLLHGIVDFARPLGMAVTAVGVESADHAEILRNLGFDTVQGNGIGEPLPASALPLDNLPAKRDLKR